EERHQRAAAADAVEAVCEAHARGARGPVAPVRGDELERHAALGEARVLRRRELPGTGGGEERGAEPGARGAHLVGEQCEVAERELERRGAEREAGPGDA